ncbi:replication protein, partial [uncultured marine virus]
MPARGSRNRAYCFTCNNYTDEQRDLLKSLDDAGTTRYIVYQPEVAPTTGTKHLQGYIVFANPRTFDGVRVLLGPQFSIQVARGDCESNYTYCSKEDSRDDSADFAVIEHGSRDSVLGTGAGS